MTVPKLPKSGRARLSPLLPSVVHMVEDFYYTALVPRDSLLLPDRYYLTVSVIEKLKSLNSSEMCIDLL